MTTSHQWLSEKCSDHRTPRGRASALQNSCLHQLLEGYRVIQALKVRITTKVSLCSEAAWILAHSKFVIDTDSSYSKSGGDHLTMLRGLWFKITYCFSWGQRQTARRAKQRTADQPEEEMETENKTLQINTIYGLCDEDSPPSAGRKTSRSAAILESKAKSSSTFSYWLCKQFPTNNFTSEENPLQLWNKSINHLSGKLDSTPSNLPFSLTHRLIITR